jgi:outer membrane biosynthesis protein TonB
MCATIGKDGRIETLRAVSGPKELVPAALDAVKKWRYQPFELKGETVEVATDIRVNFRLAQ